MTKPPAHRPDDDQPDRRSLPAMPTRRLTLPAVATLAVVSLLLGALAAFADVARPAKQDAAAPARAATVQLGVDADAAGRDAAGGHAAAVQRRAGVVRRPRVGVLSVLRALRPRLVTTTPPRCVAATKAPAAVPVPQPILDAFGVLRRDRTAGDGLPAAALNALRVRGLEPFDPAAARLLRTTAGGGRAWAVPVRDLPPTTFFGCGGGAVRPPLPIPVPVRPRRPSSAPGVRPAPTRPSTTPARPAAPIYAPPAVTQPPPATTTPAAAPAAPPAEAPPASTPPAPVSPSPRPPYKPRPGVAIVAVGDAPVGAGGTLDDLVRGRESVAVDPCAGPSHDMLSVSGIVPDGVAAAFLTAADGTAVRADVKDNAYSFVVPPAKRPEQRYVVWTGGDGTPHVQPLASLVFSVRMRCPAPARDTVRVSAGDSGICAPIGPVLVPPTPAAPGRTSVPVPVPSLNQSVACAMRAVTLRRPPTRRTPRPTKPRRHK